MAENRTRRDAQTRNRTTRKKAWQRPETLPSPEPIQGVAFKWVRVSTQGTLDPSNISSKLREGWTPVKAEDHPEMKMMATDASEKFKDNIVIGGLVLCSAPEELVQERNRYYQDQSNAQIKSVDNNYMRDNDPRMEKFSEKSTKVTFGDGR